MTGPVFLSEEALEALPITGRQVADAIESAVRQDMAGRLWVAPKASVLPGDGRYVMTTLAVGDDPALTVVKAVTVSPDNPARGLDGIEGNVFLQDSQTGLLRAVMGAKWITRVRTAGLSVVAARRLANPASTVLTFIGCGAQARGHLAAFAEAFPLTEIRMLGRGQPNIDRLRALAESLGLQAHRWAHGQEAVENADLIVSSVPLTSGSEPFIDAHWLKPGAFAAITDTAGPWHPHSLSAFKAAYIDDHRQEAAIGKPMISPDLVSGDLRDLVSGPADLFDPDRCTAFIFRGLAVGDFALAGLAYQMAREAGAGVPIG
ncbi:MAG: ornithine cyclodeaminase family protein [Pseudomonadota bacterium]